MRDIEFIPFDKLDIYHLLLAIRNYGLERTDETELIMNAIIGRKINWKEHHCRNFYKAVLEEYLDKYELEHLLAVSGYDTERYQGFEGKYVLNGDISGKNSAAQRRRRFMELNPGLDDADKLLTDETRKLRRVARELKLDYRVGRLTGLIRKAIQTEELIELGLVKLVSEEEIERIQGQKEQGEANALQPPENNETNVHFPVFSVEKDLAEYFVSREDVLGKLKEGFSDKTSRKIRILSGMGGVGKTQIALKFAHAARADYDLIRWIDATNEETLLENVEEFLDSYDTAPREEIEGLSAAVRLNRFVNRLSDKRILFIYDNADYLDEDQEKKKLLRKTLLSYMPDGDYHILITTRCNVLFNEAKPIRVDVFEPEAALEYLTKKAGRPACPEAEVLAERMGYLPLALCYVGAYIEAQKNMTYADYLKRWDENGLIVFDQEDFAEKTVRRALTITLDKLDPERRSFWYALLRQAAHMGGEYFAPKAYAELVCKTSNNSILVHEPITATFRALKNFVENALDSLKLEQAMNILRKYSLADWDGTRMTVHPMLKETIWAENHGDASVLDMEMHRSNMYYHLMNMYQQAGDKFLERKYGQLIVLERLETLEIVLKEAQKKAKENGTKPDYQLMKDLLERKEFGGFILEYGNAEDKEKLATIEKIVTEEEAD